MDERLFPLRLKELRTKKKMTLDELARAVGTTKTTLSRYENAERSPKLEIVAALALFFDVDMIWLAGGDSSDSQEKRPYSDTWLYDYYDRDVAAGELSLIDDLKKEEVEKIEIADTIMGRYAGQSNVFFTRVNGKSMNKFIPDHSLIAVKRLDSFYDFSDEDIVLFSYDNGYSIKRFYNDTENKQLIFRPESTVQGFYDIVIPYENAENLELAGKVILYVVNID